MKKTVENPWGKFNKKSFCTKADEVIINNFNEKLKQKDKQENDSPFFIDLRLMPEPYIGNPDANVIFLFTNPGLKGTELNEYEEFAEFKQALIRNLGHNNKDYPNYYFNPAFTKTVNGKEKYIAGAEWLLKRTKELRKHVGENSHKILSQGIFIFQLHPYHSKKFKAIEELEVEKYTMHLLKNSIERAKKGEAIIICIRCYKEWNEKYRKLFSGSEDMEKELGENFILLKMKNGKTPRTPYFNQNQLTKTNFDKVVTNLKKNL